MVMTRREKWPLGIDNQMQSKPKVCSVRYFSWWFWHRMVPLEAARAENGPGDSSLV